MLKSGFLKSKAAKIATAILLLQALVTYGFSRDELTPAHVPLNTVSGQFGHWSMISESVVDDDVQQVLRASDLLSRTYGNNSSGISAHLFVAYFDTQRAGQTPHSPKNCLPGSGWIPSQSGELAIDVQGRPPVVVNRYVVAKGESRTLVLYWYQSRDRIVADEYKAKFYVLADALRYNRTDTALVRVTVPIQNNDVKAAQDAAVDFVQSFFMPLRAHFPA